MPKRWTKRRSGVRGYRLLHEAIWTGRTWIMHVLLQFASSDFWNLFSNLSEMVFGDPNPICFHDGIAISERGVEWIIIPWCKNNRQIDREPPPYPRRPSTPLLRDRSSRKYRSRRDYIDLMISWVFIFIGITDNIVLLLAGKSMVCQLFAQYCVKQSGVCVHGV